MGRGCRAQLHRIFPAPLREFSADMLNERLQRLSSTRLVGLDAELQRRRAAQSHLRPVQRCLRAARLGRPVGKR
jgi:hypothetical protein